MGYRRRGWGWRTTWNRNHDDDFAFVGPTLIWFFFLGPILGFLASTIATPFGWFVYFAPIWLGAAIAYRHR